MADLQRLGRHRQPSPEKLGAPGRRGYRARPVIAVAAAAIAVALAVTFAVHIAELSARDRNPAQAGAPARAGASARQDGRIALPTTPGSYIGLYPDGVPNSYGGVTAFAKAARVKPSAVLYYSGWMQPFEASFAATVATNGAVPIVQLDPKDISIAAIASGKYDGYLSEYAEAVRAYHHPVVLSFGHEMNGYWYSWGYTHTSPAVFVAAWRHIVTLFRIKRTRNVTWMWTINTVHKRANVPSPGPWWPGSSYVTWVGIDGYYYDSSLTFAALFGPTIAVVRALTHDPILIAETGAVPAAGQPAKIADLFSGIHLYELLGFVWFNAVHAEDWRLRGAAAFAAFRRGVETYHGPAS